MITGMVITPKPSRAQSCAYLVFLKYIISWNRSKMFDGSALSFQVWNMQGSGIQLLMRFTPDYIHYVNWSNIITLILGFRYIVVPLQWRHNRHHVVSNHQPHHCLLKRLFGRRSKKTSKLRVTGLCEGNSPVTGEFPAQMASNAENVSIWWRHHAISPMLHRPYISKEKGMSLAKH